MKKLVAFMISVMMIGSMLSGCGGGSGDDIPETDPEELTESTSNNSAAAFDGWWVISPNYYEGVIPVISIFCVDTQAGQWTPYDRMGTPGNTMSCSFPDESNIVLDMDVMGQQEMYLENGILYYMDDDHEAFIHTEDPGFVQLGDFSGTWNFMGNSDLGIAYEFTEDQAKKLENGEATLEGPYSRNLVSLGSYTGDPIAEVPCLEQEWPAPALYPSGDGLYLIEKDSFRNNVYVRDDASLPEKMVNLVDILVNSDFAAPGEDDSSYLRLAFDSAVFRIITMRADGEGWYSQDTEAEEICGTWTLDQDLVLHLSGDTAQDLDLTQWMQEAPLQIAQKEFTLQNYNSYQ